MFRMPVHGFARRVDDTVARAMLILMSREDCNMRQFPAAGSNLDPKAKCPNPDT